MDGQEKTVMGVSQRKHHQKRHGMNADAEEKWNPLKRIGDALERGNPLKRIAVCRQDDSGESLT